MKIGIDARMFARGKNTGVEEFTKCFLEALFQGTEKLFLDNDADDDMQFKYEFILFFNSWKNTAVDFSWATKYKNVTVKECHWPNKLLNFSLWFLKWPKLDKMCNEAEVFYMPNIGFAAFSRKAKFILTIHDLSFEHYSQAFSWKKRIWHFIVNPRLLCKRADKILAVSTFTKQDIENVYRIDSKKVALALSGRTGVQGNLGRNDISLIKVKDKYKLPFNFILYFGTIEPRKNIISLIKAFEMLREQNSQIEHSLVIAGARGWKAQKIYQAIEMSKFSDDIIVINDLPQGDKETLLTLASAFVFPSFFEGFGFPAMEAISCGVPTIVSHISSLPEVVAKNAIIIDPLRSEEITVALKEILNNNKMSSILNRNKIRQLQKFQWNKVVDIFLKSI